LTLTRDEVEEWCRGIGIRKFDNEGRFVVTRHPGFWLYNVYFPNGGSGETRHNFKQEFLEKFRLHLKKHLARGEEVIVLGDYNVAHEDIDVYDPKTLSKKSGFLPEEREWLTRFLETGFHDTFREHHPGEEGRYSWWSYRENARLGNRGWRIDMICVSPGLVERVKRADILEDQEGSDHCPILIELEEE
jgi:exodeoxyribonuclease-3